jgi:protein gp37
MGKSTGIQYCDDTINPTTGCDGCELWIPGKGGPCYAGTLHETRLALSLPALYAPSFTEIRLAPGRMQKAANCMDLSGKDRSAGKGRQDKPWLNGHRRMIFLGDLGDIFSKDVPFPYLKEQLVDVALSDTGKRHDWLCLTKQPQRALAFATWLDVWPSNIWLGTSITGKASLKRLDHLVKHPAVVKYISLEPQIEDIDLIPWLDRVSWVIQGGESDQTPYEGRPFSLDWARKTRDACKKFKVAYFLKQLGSHPVDDGELVLQNGHGGDWEEWAEDLRVREVP